MWNLHGRESGTSGTKGKLHTYYKCASVKRKKVAQKTVRKQWIEDIAKRHYGCDYGRCHC